MIEIEKKFVLDLESEKRLLQGAEFLGEKNYTDVYYDDETYSLTRKDCWLRKRNGKFEIKISLNVALGQRVSDAYEELEDEEKIKEYLKLDNGPLENLLSEKGFKPFSTIVTHRRKYKRGEFAIDVDVADFGYNIVEIELLTEDISKAEEATHNIMDLPEILA